MSKMFSQCELILVAMVVALVGCSEGGDGRGAEALKGLADSAVVPLVNRSSEVSSSPAPLGNTHSFVDWQVGVRQKLLEHIPVDQYDSTAPDFDVIERVMIDGTVERASIRFRTFDGAWLPGVLQQPVSVKRAPAVLVIPGHVRQGDSGLYQLVFDAGSYQRAAATELAKAGFVTLTFELRGFGLLGDEAGTNHLHVAFNAIATGSFYKSVVLQDAAMALGLLRSMPRVDPMRVATAGASYGGELAVALAALDSRIAAVAFSSYGGRTGPFSLAAGADSKQRHYCHVIPGSQSWLRQEDIFLLVAPRPLRGFRGADDSHVENDFDQVLQDTWQTSGSERTARMDIIEAAGHDFFVPETVDFLTSVLGDLP